MKGALRFVVLSVLAHTGDPESLELGTSRDCEPRSKK